MSLMEYNVLWATRPKNTECNNYAGIYLNMKYVVLGIYVECWEVGRLGQIAVAK